MLLGAGFVAYIQRRRIAAFFAALRRHRRQQRALAGLDLDDETMQSAQGVLDAVDAALAALDRHPESLQKELRPSIEAIRVQVPATAGQLGILTQALKDTTATSAARKEAESALADHRGRLESARNACERVRLSLVSLEAESLDEGLSADSDADDIEALVALARAVRQELATV